MFPTPVPFPSDAVYATVNVRALSYFGKGLAAEIGGSVSTMTNDSVWLVAISTNRGSFVNEYGRYVTLAWVRLSVGIQIGRASCRERGERWEGAEVLKKKAEE